MNQVSDEYGKPFFFNFLQGVFVKPFIILDKLQDKELPPVIENHFDVAFLKSLDFTLYAKALTKKTIWVKRQKFSLHILPSEEPHPEGYKKINLLPPNHYFERDSANHKVRLIGIFTNPTGYGRWHYY